MRFLTINSISSVSEHFTARGVSLTFLDRLSVAIAAGRTAKGTLAPAGIWTGERINIQLIPARIPFILTVNIVPGVLSDNVSTSEEEAEEWIDVSDQIADNLPDMFDQLAVAYLRKALDEDRVSKADTVIVTELIDKLADHRPVLTASEENALREAMADEVHVQDVNLIGSAMAKSEAFQNRKINARTDFVKTMARLEADS